MRMTITIRRQRPRPVIVIIAIRRQRPRCVIVIIAIRRQRARCVIVIIAIRRQRPRRVTMLQVNRHLPPGRIHRVSTPRPHHKIVPQIRRGIRPITNLPVSRNRPHRPTPQNNAPDGHQRTNRHLRTRPQKQAPVGRQRNIPILRKKPTPQLMNQPKRALINRHITLQLRKSKQKTTRPANVVTFIDRALTSN